MKAIAERKVKGESCQAEQAEATTKMKMEQLKTLRVDCSESLSCKNGKSRVLGCWIRGGTRQVKRTVTGR